MNKLTKLRKKLVRDTLELEIPIDMKLRLLKGVFKGKEAFIFAAGPSLSSVNIEKIKPLLEDNLVICIKQSINIVSSDCDVLLMNFCNFNDYNWSELKCPVIWTSFESKHSDIIKSRKLKCDELLPVIENGKNDKQGLSSSTAGKRLWSNFSRLSEGSAIWGPGLMYELAFPLALNCGVEHITLVSWDIGALKETNNEAFLNEHFYKNKNVEMKTKITNFEIEVVSKSTKGLKEWLNNNGVGLSIISDRSLVDMSIKREDKWLKKVI